MTSSDELLTELPDVLSAEELANAYKRWQAPRVLSADDAEKEQAQSLLNIEALESLQKQAEEEGYKAGYESGHQAGFSAGLKAAENEIKQRIEHLQSIVDFLAQPLESLHETMEQDLVQMVILMAKQLVRRELSTQPDQVVAAMRSALTALPLSERKLKVYVHPLDLEILQGAFSIQQDEQKWHWIEDPLLTRGGVRLETADTSIDATVEARLNSLIQAVWGEARHHDPAQ
ncbi:flagellar assembly protein FliH [Methylophaga lonarensis MPL]|uniref:Flagellar assembly protein FliH n=1 Tax=Methylophaga lonarensis MPL TaxID=1286106 RepID=M7NZN2_9GAMM|nr:flagellar assembly protein FliH [Methylophaga lonarensis]EMR14278.1 flagellar assembly protein FliH [Methylophaga lonarensis MPL]